MLVAKFLLTLLCLMELTEARSGRSHSSSRRSTTHVVHVNGYGGYGRRYGMYGSRACFLEDGVTPVRCSTNVVPPIVTIAVIVLIAALCALNHFRPWEKKNAEYEEVPEDGENGGTTTPPQIVVNGGGY